MKKNICLILIALLATFYAESQSITATINGPLQTNCGTVSNFTLTILGLYNTQSTTNCSGEAITHIGTKWFVNNAQKGTGTTLFSFNPTATEISNSGGIFWISAELTIHKVILSPPDVPGQPCKQVTTTQIVTPISWVVNYRGINTYAQIYCSNPTIIKGCQTPIQFELINYGIGVNYSSVTFNWTLPSGWVQQSISGNSITVIPPPNPSATATLSCSYSYAGCNSSKSFTGFNLVNQVLTGSMNGTDGKIICPNTSYIFTINPVTCGTANYSWNATGWTNLILSNGNRTLQATSPTVLTSSNLGVTCTASFTAINPPTPISKNFQLYKRASFATAPMFTVFNTATATKKSVVVSWVPPANTTGSYSICRISSPTSLFCNSMSSSGFLALNNQYFRVTVCPNGDCLDCQGNDIGFCAVYQLQNASSSSTGQFNVISYCVVARMVSKETNDENIIQEFKIYPNPSNGVFNINTNYQGPSMLRVFNQIGQLVYNSEIKEMGNIRVDLSKYSNGIYYVLHLDQEGKSLNKEAVQLQK